MIIDLDHHMCPHKKSLIIHVTETLLTLCIDEGAVLRSARLAADRQIRIIESKTDIETFYGNNLNDIKKVINKQRL